MQAIVKPIFPVRSLFPDGPPSSRFSHMMRFIFKLFCFFPIVSCSSSINFFFFFSLDDRTENIVVPMACSVDLYGEQVLHKCKRDFLQGLLTSVKIEFQESWEN